MKIKAPPNEIRVENVSYAYANETVIENAHFHIEEGSFVSFIGPNGGGKTTLAKLILGILAPDKGFISVFGRTPKESSSSIGYVPQHSNFDPDFPINVLDVALMGRLSRRLGFFSKQDKDKALFALDQTGLGGYEKRSFADLSGGERQRVLIARALSSNPKALLLDEPTSSIDPQAETMIYNLLTELNRKITIILISHDLTFVSEQIEKVICIDRRVVIHPTGKFSEESYNKLFGRQLRMIHHETKLEEENHG